MNSQEPRHHRLRTRIVEDKSKYNRDREKDIQLATYHMDDAVALESMDALRELNPTYHWCDSWDGLVICDEDPEYKWCNCK